MYEVVFVRSAYKEYRKVPQRIRQRIEEVLQILCINPVSDVLKIRKIRGLENHYRIRVGDYRIIYSPQHDKLIIRVIRVGHRRDVYDYF